MKLFIRLIMGFVLGFLGLIQSIEANSFGENSKPQDFYKRHGEGWFWYEDPKLEEEQELINVQKQPESSPKESAQKKLSPEQVATQEVETYKKSIEGKRNMALANPTYENVTDYIRIQKDMTQRSMHFAEVWKTVVLNEPELNHERVYPTAQYARHIQNDEQNRAKESLIRNLSQEYGLFYFFQGSCPYCEGFSPIVKLFAEKYDWDVIAISLDGSPNDQFENVQMDNGMAQGLGIKGVPALVAYHAGTGNLIPISYAMTSLDRLEDNVLTLMKNGAGER